MTPVLAEKQECAVRDCAFALLERSGFRAQNSECLKALEAYGCTVNWDSNLVRLSEAKIVEILAIAKACNTSPGSYLPVGTPVGGIQPLYLAQSGKPRAPRTDDLLKSLKIVDELVGVSSVAPPLTNSQANPHIEPVETLALTMMTCKKPITGFDVVQPGLASYLVRLGEIYTGVPASTHFLHGIYCVDTPLTFNDRVCRCMIERAPYSITAVPTPMPISGANVPIAPHTAMAVAIAEIIAGWAIALALNPKNTLAGLACTGSLDMSTGRARFSSIEAIRQDAGVVQVLGRGCGTAIECAHCYTDASEPGYPAVGDKYFKSLTLHQFGAGIGYHQGTLDAGKIYSNEQLTIDVELNEILQKHASGLPDDSEMMLDLLLEAGSDPHHEWLSDPSTIENMRTIQQPLDLLRPESACDILERASEKCEDALARYTPPELPADKVKAIAKVIEQLKMDNG